MLSNRRLHLRRLIVTTLVVAAAAMGPAGAIEPNRPGLCVSDADLNQTICVEI